MMMTECPVCGSSQVTRWKTRNLDGDLAPDDFKITDSRYGVTLTLHRCGDCSFIFADPSETCQLTTYYEQLVDPGYGDGAAHRTLQMCWLLRLGMAARMEARTLLEIGAGTGLLVAQARQIGLDAVGVEPSRSLVSEAQHIHGVELLQGTYPHSELDGRQFDLVYLVDVIEHVEDPVGLLAHCSAALAPGGMMIVVTPNVSSLAARLFGHRWWHLRLAHVGYFNHRSMGEACSRAGLAIHSVGTARWFFPIRYLAQRTSVYLPVGALNRAAERIGPLRWLYDRVIALNLFDSCVFVLTRKG
jgi:SAM-dependent methyltransferase